MILGYRRVGIRFYSARERCACLVPWGRSRTFPQRAVETLELYSVQTITVHLPIAQTRSSAAIQGSYSKTRAILNPASQPWIRYFIQAC